LRPLSQPVGDLVERVERATVHLARLRAHEDGTGEIREELGPQASLVVRGHDGDPPATQPDQPEGLRQGGVCSLADDHLDLRRAEQPVGLDVPAQSGEQRVPGRGEAGRVRHRRPADERHAGLRGEPQEVDQPAAHDLVQLRRDRGHDRQGGVLVPGAGQPRAADSHRQRGADHEAEVAPAGGRDRRRAPDGVELVERRAGVDACFGERLVERGERGHGVWVRRHATVVDRRRVLERGRHGGSQDVVLGADPVVDLLDLSSHSPSLASGGRAVIGNRSRSA
jgi:hypothetical protein